MLYRRSRGRQTGARGVRYGSLSLRTYVVRAPSITDHVCGVVGVCRVDLHPARMRSVDKRSKLVIGAQMWSI